MCRPFMSCLHNKALYTYPSCWRGFSCWNHLKGRGESLFFPTWEWAAASGGSPGQLPWALGQGGGAIGRIMLHYKLNLNNIYLDLSSEKTFRCDFLISVLVIHIQFPSRFLVPHKGSFIKEQNSILANHHLTASLYTVKTVCHAPHQLVEVMHQNAERRRRNNVSYHHEWCWDWEGQTLAVKEWHKVLL